jgi:hypothetical protein
MTTGLMLPPELSGLLNTLGFTWPEGNERTIFDMAGEWMSLADELRPAIDEAHQHAEDVWKRNYDKAIEQFQTFWNGAEAPKQNLDDGATAASMIGAGLNVCAGVLVALKIAVIAQLVVLALQIAQALATAVATFGASLAQIPIFRETTRILLDQALDIAINTVLNG